MNIIDDIKIAIRDISIVSYFEWPKNKCTAIFMYHVLMALLITLYVQPIVFICSGIHWVWRAHLLTYWLLSYKYCYQCFLDLITAVHKLQQS